jgi:hypothetical protein
MASDPKKTTQNEVEEKLGQDKVNHLVALYLGRNASSQEINRFKNANVKDERILRDYLDKIRKEAMGIENVQKDLSLKTMKMKGKQAIDGMGGAPMPTQPMQVDSLSQPTDQLTSTPQAPQMSAPSSPTIENVFDGNLILVRFTDDPTPTDPIEDAGTTIWLFNKNDGTYTPFNSPAAIEAYIGKPIQEITPLINNVSTTILGDPAWKGKFIARKDAIQDDGTIPDNPNFIYESGKKTSDTNMAYGKPLNPETNQKAADLLDKMLGRLTKK